MTGPEVDLTPEAWMSSAVCAQQAAIEFHPDGHTGRSYLTAIKLCRTCPVQAECLTHALNIEGDVAHTYRHGIWGGTTPREREQLAKAGDQ